MWRAAYFALFRSWFEFLKSSRRDRISSKVSIMVPNWVKMFSQTSIRRNPSKPKKPKTNLETKDIFQKEIQQLLSKFYGNFHKTARSNPNLQREGFQTFVKCDLYRISTILLFTITFWKSQACGNWVHKFSIQNPPKFSCSKSFSGHYPDLLQNSHLCSCNILKIIRLQKSHKNFPW